MIERLLLRLTRVQRASVFTALIAIVTFAASLGWALPAAAEAAAAARAVDPDVLRWAYLSAALSTGVSSIAAAYAVARVGTAAVGGITEKPEIFGRLIVLVGLAEGIAIYGLIVSILLLNKVP